MGSGFCQRYALAYVVTDLQGDWDILVKTATKKRVEDGIKLLETSGWQTLMEILRSST